MWRYTERASSMIINCVLYNYVHSYSLTCVHCVLDQCSFSKPYSESSAIFWFFNILTKPQFGQKHKFCRCDFNPIGYVETQNDDTKIPGRNILKLKLPKHSCPKIDLVDLLFNQSVFDDCISDKSSKEEVLNETCNIKILKNNQKKQAKITKKSTKISNDKSKKEKVSTLNCKNYTDIYGLSMDTDTSSMDSACIALFSAF